MRVRTLLLVSAVIASLAVGSGVAVAVPGSPPIRVAHSQLTVDLDGLTGEYPLADGTVDEVMFSGRLHIVSNVKLDADGAATSLILNMNLQGADAVGDFAYAIGGSGKVVAPSGPPFFPTDPLRYTAFFTVRPTVPPNPTLPPSPIQPFRVGLDLTFDSAGALTEATIGEVFIGGIGTGD